MKDRGCGELLPSLIACSALIARDTSCDNSCSVIARRSAQKVEFDKWEIIFLGKKFRFFCLESLLRKPPDYTNHNI